MKTKLYLAGAVILGGLIFFHTSHTDAAISGYDAAFVSDSVPTTMEAGKTYTVTVTMQNTGSVAWTTANQIKLGSQNPQDNRTWGIPRVLLDASESVGTSGTSSTKTFTFNVTAPTTPGTYGFQWQMVKEFSFWFGAKSTQRSITVVQPSTTKPSVRASVSSLMPDPQDVLLGATNVLAHAVRFTTANDGMFIETLVVGLRPGDANDIKTLYVEYTNKSGQVLRSSLPFGSTREAVFTFSPNYPTGPDGRPYIARDQMQDIKIYADMLSASEAAHDGDTFALVFKPIGVSSSFAKFRGVFENSGTVVLGGEPYVTDTVIGNPITVRATVISPTPSPLICSYPAPPTGCSYVPGPSYNPATTCGMVLSCTAPTPTPTPTPSSTPTLLKLITPKGGETWDRGGTYAITWQSSGFEKVALQIGCAPWSTGYIENLPSTLNGGTYSFTVPYWVSPDPDAGSCHVDVVGGSLTSPRIRGITYDTNDTGFTVAGPRPVPAVEIVSPNGGQTFQIGDTVVIQWKRNWYANYDNGSVQVGLNSDIFGFSAGRIGENITGTSYTWKIPSTIKEGSSYRFAVTAFGFGGSQAMPLSDSSDGLISIRNTQTTTPTPSVTPTSTPTPTPSPTPYVTPTPTPAPTPQGYGTLIGRVAVAGTSKFLYDGSPFKSCKNSTRVSSVFISYAGPINGTTHVNLCNPEPYYSVRLPVGTYSVVASVPAPYITYRADTATVTITKDTTTHQWFKAYLAPIPTPTPYPTPTSAPTTVIFPLSQIKSGDLIRAQGTDTVYVVYQTNGVWASRKFSSPQNLALMYGPGAINTVKIVTPETLARFTR